MKKSGKGGRPRKLKTDGLGNLRVPPPTMGDLFRQASLAPFGINEHEQRLLAELSLKADPHANNPEIQTEFARVIAGFPELDLSNESIISKAIEDGEEGAVDGVAESLEARRQKSRDFIGAIMARTVEHSSPDQAEEFFAYVVRLMRSLKAPKHRNALAYRAYTDFIRETGREPSKPELRKFMEARPERYPDRPADPKGWSRLWKDCGLGDLAR